MLAAPRAVEPVVTMGALLCDRASDTFGLSQDGGFEVSPRTQAAVTPEAMLCGGAHKPFALSDLYGLKPGDGFELAKTWVATLEPVTTIIMLITILEHLNIRHRRLSAQGAAM
jgi:hypothetical protein